jgi:hypothetical protein
VLPRYIESGPRASFPPPFLSSGGSFLGFLLKGEPTAIQGLVDNTFNAVAAPEVEYEPIGPLIVMMVGEFKHQSSLAQNFINSGWTSETAAVLWLPLIAKQAGVADRLCLAAPYVLVDNEMSLICGREDFGYAKALAEFAPASGLGVNVTVKAFGGDFGLGAKAEWRQLIELTALGVGPSVAGLAGSPSIAQQSPLAVVLTELVTLAANQWLDVEDIARFIADLSMIVEAIVSDKARHVFLKQFRDAQSSTAACYQEVVEAPVEFSGVTGGISPYLWQMRINAMESHPIAKDLGVTTPLISPAFELHTDMKLDLAALVIRSAAAGLAPPVSPASGVAPPAPAAAGPVPPPSP